MTRDLTHSDPGVILPGDPPGMIRVPAWRLDETERLRAELAQLRSAVELHPGRPGDLTRRATRVGPVETYREGVPLRSHATPDRANALADLILSLRAMGALAVAGLAFLSFVVGAAVLTGLVFLAIRFVEWARYGSAAGGAAVLGISGLVIVATGVAVFLRLTDPRRTR